MGCLSAKVTYCHRSPQKAGTFSSWCLLLLWFSLEEVRNMEMERLQARILGKHSIFLWPLQGSMFSYGPRERNEKSAFFFFFKLNPNLPGSSLICLIKPKCLCLTVSSQYRLFNIPRRTSDQTKSLLWFSFTTKVFVGATSLPSSLFPHMQ